MAEASPLYLPTVCALHLGSHTSNEVQTLVTSILGELQSHGDFVALLASIYAASAFSMEAQQQRARAAMNGDASVPTLPLGPRISQLYQAAVQHPADSRGVRMRAGLMLKNAVLFCEESKTSTILAGPSGEHTKTQLLSVLADSDAEMRLMGGTVVTGVLCRLRITHWPQALEILIEGLGEIPGRGEGCLDSLMKVSEDYVKIVAAEAADKMPSPFDGGPPVVDVSRLSTDVQNFIGFASAHLLPRVMTLTMSCIQRKYWDATARGFALLSAFVQADLISPRFPTLSAHAQDLTQLLIAGLGAAGEMPVDQHCATMAADATCSALEWMLQYRPQLLNPHTARVAHALIELSASAEYEVRFAAMRCWPFALRSLNHSALDDAFFDRAARVWVENTIFHDRDFMDWTDMSVAADVSAEFSQSEIAPAQATAARRGGGEAPAEDNAAWSSTITARKLAASAIDTAAQVLNERMVARVFPLATQRISHLLQSGLGQWERGESGVLTLGALIGGAGISHMAAQASEIFHLLLRIAEIPLPPANSSGSAAEHAWLGATSLRSIALWTLGVRFSSWVLSDLNPEQLPCIDALMGVLGRNCVLPSKRVQHAAISALAAFLAQGHWMLQGYLADLVEICDRTLPVYNGKNLLVAVEFAGSLITHFAQDLEPPHVDALATKVAARLRDAFGRMERNASDAHAKQLFVGSLDTTAHFVRQRLCPAQLAQDGSAAAKAMLTAYQNAARAQGELYEEKALAVASLELLCCFTETFPAADITQMLDGFAIDWALLLRDSGSPVRQSAAGFFGVCASVEVLGRIMGAGQFAECIGHLVSIVNDPSPLVAQNACWAVAESIVVSKGAAPAQVLQAATRELVTLMKSAWDAQDRLFQDPQFNTAVQNAALALGRIVPYANTNDLTDALPMFILPWTRSMMMLEALDLERLAAAEGLAALVARAPGATCVADNQGTALLTFMTWAAQFPWAVPLRQTVMSETFLRTTKEALSTVARQHGAATMEQQMQSVPAPLQANLQALLG